MSGVGCYGAQLAQAPTLKRGRCRMEEQCSARKRCNSGGGGVCVAAAAAALALLPRPTYYIVRVRRRHELPHSSKSRNQHHENEEVKRHFLARPWCGWETLSVVSLLPELQSSKRGTLVAV